MNLTDVPEFTVDRRTWARGQRNGEPALLNEQGCRCCLGFYAAACGVPDADMSNEQSPGSIYGWETKLIHAGEGAGGIYHVDAQCTTLLMRTNDATNLTEDEREARLTEQFAAIGITVRFVGPYQST